MRPRSRWPRRCAARWCRARASPRCRRTLRRSGRCSWSPDFAVGGFPPAAALRFCGPPAASPAPPPETPSETLEKELLAEIDRIWPGFGRSVDFTRVFRHRYGAPRFDVGAYRALARFERVQADRPPAGRRPECGGDYRVHPALEGMVRSGERAAADLLGG